MPCKCPKRAVRQNHLPLLTLPQRGKRKRVCVLLVIMLLRCQRNMICATTNLSAYRSAFLFLKRVTLAHLVRPTQSRLRWEGWRFPKQKNQQSRRKKTHLCRQSAQTRSLHRPRLRRHSRRRWWMRMMKKTKIFQYFLRNPNQNQSLRLSQPCPLCQQSRRPLGPLGRFRALDDEAAFAVQSMPLQRSCRQKQKPRRRGHRRRRAHLCGRATLSRSKTKTSLHGNLLQRSRQLLNLLQDKKRKKRLNVLKWNDSTRRLL